MERPEKEKYGDNWLDEGLIAYSESPYTCPACVVAKKGSKARTLLAPPEDCAFVVTPTRISLDPEMLRQCHGETGQGMKRSLFEKPLGVEDVLREYRTYDVPFGIVIGTGGDAKKHFLRSVPLNYDTGDVIAVYAVASYSAAYLRPSAILAAVEKAANWEQAAPAQQKKRSSPWGRFYAYINELQRDLTPAEAAVMWMLAKRYAPSREH